MSKQINFLISPKMEQELIKFIGEQCAGKILLPFLDDDKSLLEYGDEVSLHVYYISPCSCDFEPKYEQGNWIDNTQKMRLKTISEVYPFIYPPLIEYSRFIFDKEETETLTGSRIYCQFLSGQDNGALKEVYKKLEYWIKKNAAKVERDFGIPIYVLDKSR